MKDMRSDHPIVEHLPQIRRYAMSLTRDSDAACDLVQTVAMQAIAKFHLFIPGTNLLNWLATITHHEYVNTVRVSARRIVMTELSDAVLDTASSPPTQMEGLKLRDLRRALDQLPPEQKDALLLIGIDQLSYDRVAAMHAVPVGTVRSRLSRGRIKLRVITEGASDPLHCADPTLRQRRSSADTDAVS